MRKVAVDSFSTLSFFTLAGMATEVFILQMSIEQSIKAREFAAVVNILTGSPYGRFRDLVFRKMKTTEQSSFARKMLSDTVAFIPFQGALYAGILKYAGADTKQILSGVCLVALSAGFVGRPLGLYQDALRRATGLKPAYSPSALETEPES